MLPVRAIRRESPNASVKPASAPGELHQRVVQSQHHRTHVGQPLLVDQADQLLFVTLFVAGHADKILHIGIIRIEPARILLAQFHPPHGKRHTQHTRQQHVEPDFSPRRSHVASRAGPQQGVMPFFIRGNAQQHIAVRRTLLHLRESAIDFITGRLVTLEGHHVFHSDIHISNHFTVAGCAGRPSLPPRQSTKYLPPPAP